MYFKRSKVYTNVVTPTIGNSETNSSEVMYPYEQFAFGECKVHTHVEDDTVTTAIVDNVTGTLYVSFDEGTTWEPAVAVSEIVAGTAAPFDVYDNVLYAPRIRFDLTADGTGEVLEAAGLKVNIQMDQADVIGGKFKVSYPSADLEDIGNSETKYSQILSVSQVPERVAMIATVDDLSAVTDTVTYALESSMDGVNYWTVTDTAKTDIAAGSGTLYSETEETDKLGLYFRIAATADGTGATTSAGIRFYMISMK
jgi:hypothetical protein